MNKQNKSKFIDTENKLVVTTGESGWGAGERGEVRHLYGWSLDFWGDHFVVYTDVES